MAQEQITFLHPELDLIPLDMFKIVHDGQFVDVSDTSQPFHLFTLPTMDVQDETKGDKATNDANMVVTSPRSSLEEKLVLEEGQ